MKTPNDPRHQKRRLLVQELFRRSFHDQKIDGVAKEIFEKREDLDEKIHLAATEFPIDKINKVDLAILRLGAYELLMDKKEPPHVVVDEAVELAKEFGNDTSPAFVNGVLGNILKS